MTRSSRFLILGVLLGAGLTAATAAVRARLAPPHRRAGSSDGSRPARRTGVSVVDDPDGTMRLIAVDGPIESAAIREIATAVSGARPGTSFHLDLSGVRAWPEGALAHLEDLFDDVEVSGAHLRVVGIDPRLTPLPTSWRR